MSNPAGQKEWLEIDDWKTRCLLAEQKCQLLQEKLDLMTENRERLISKIEELKDDILISKLKTTWY